MEISQKVKECTSMVQIVNLINNAWICSSSAEQLAAEHAFVGVDLDCTDKGKLIKSSLRLLRKSGAKFDWQKALCLLDRHLGS